jgi:hypothetical protein
MGGGQSSKNSVGGLLTSTVSMLLLRTIRMSGICHRFLFLSNHSFNTAAHGTFNVVFCMLYIFTSSLSQTVIYPAAENLVVLRGEMDLMDGKMWTTFAGCQTLCASTLTLVAAVGVPLSSWKILLDVRPVGMKRAVVVPMLKVAALSVTIDGMEPSRTPCLMNCLRTAVFFTLLTCLGGL